MAAVRKAGTAPGGARVRVCALAVEYQAKGLRFTNGVFHLRNTPFQRNAFNLGDESGLWADETELPDL
jgi:hypothetical protein